MINNRSITTQFTIVFVVALLLVVGSFFLVLDSVYRTELKSQAETVADNVDAFGTWVSQYGRVWVRDNDKSFLGQVTLVNAPDAAGTGASAPADVWHFYSKNPALAQREFSEVVEKSNSSAKFRVTSHNYMNPVNKPDAFEVRALDRIRANQAGVSAHAYDLAAAGDTGCLAAATGCTPGQLAGADGKAVPINDRAIRRLVDVEHSRIKRGNGGASSGHGAANRICPAAASRRRAEWR